MPKYNNSFRKPRYIEETIENANGAVLGTVRLKPSSVLWRAPNKQDFLSVTLDQFVQWVSDPRTGAKSVTQ